MGRISLSVPFKKGAMLTNLNKSFYGYLGVKIDKYRYLGANFAVDTNLGVKIDGNR